MSERFTKLFAAQENLYAETSPVVIAAGALLKDNQTGKVLAQLKMRNIGAKEIKAATVLIRPFDTVGDPLGAELTYQYLDLSAVQGQDFGAKTPIPLADAATRSFSATVKSIIFADNSTYTAADELWEPLPAPVTLDVALQNAELVRQYRMKYGADCNYMPTAHRDIWCCTCGEWSRRYSTCCHCGKSLSALMAVDLTALRAERDARLYEERKKAFAAFAAAEERAKKAKKAAKIIVPLLAVIVAAYFLITQVIIPNVQYNNAVDLMDAGQYEEAIAAFEAMDGYKDSVMQITACEAAIETAIKDSEYDNAVALINTGDIISAYEALIALDGYKDSADKASSIYDEYLMEKKLKNLKVGDYVFFGSYEQDNNTSNGAEGIEWLVLDVEDGKALVISKYALDNKPYNTDDTEVTWETCSLRQWLNNDFVNTAFSDDEKELIPTVTVADDEDSEYSADPGNATQDQVFLLSVTEAGKYFSSASASKCKPTDYALANGVDVNSDIGYYCMWWQRSHQFSSTCRAAYITSDGVRMGWELVNIDLPVRPAMWINLDSQIFKT